MNRAGRILSVALLVAGLTAALGACPRPALAVPVSASELRARQDFAAGRYQEALEIFAELYAKTADPIFLRNIARCYQKQARTEEAITSFREYLAKARKLAPGEKDEIEGFIRQLEASRPAEKTSSAPAAAAAPERVEPATEPAAAPARDRAPAADADATTAPAQAPAAAARVETPGAPRSAPPRAEERDTGGGVSAAGVAFTAAGAALVGAGLYFGLAARSAAHSVAVQYDPDKDSAGRRDATLQWIGYGAGAAAIVTGIVFFVRGPAAPDSAGVRIGLWPGRVWLSGTF